MQVVATEKLSKEKILALHSNDPVWLQEKRLQAFEQFEKLEMPSFKYGLGIFAQLDLNFENITLKKSNVHFPTVDGVKILAFSELADTHPETLHKIKNIFSALLPIQNKIDAFHYAFCNDIIIMNEKDAKLNLSFLIDEFAAQHFIIIVKENTAFTITEKVKGSGVRTNKVEIMVEPHATLNYTTLQCMDKGISLSTKKAMVEEHGLINWFDGIFGADHAKTMVSSILHGNHASTTIKNIFFGINNQLFDLQSTAVHHAPDTTSKIISKGCLDHQSKAIVHGLIEIQESAPRSEGSQKEETLLLSNEAEADAIPDLKIHNHDVKCGHGASVGHIDKEHLFYLMSRGLTEQEAKKLVIRGFFAEIEDEEIQILIGERLG